MTGASILTNPRTGQRFTTDCEHPDPLADCYEPCESCGMPVALHATGWVESDFATGCPIDDEGQSMGHSSNWTTHDPARCRSVQRAALARKSAP